MQRHPHSPEPRPLTDDEWETLDRLLCGDAPEIEGLDGERSRAAGVAEFAVRLRTVLADWRAAPVDLAQFGHALGERLTGQTSSGHGTWDTHRSFDGGLGTHALPKNTRLARSTLRRPAFWTTVLLGCLAVIVAGRHVYRAQATRYQDTLHVQHFHTEAGQRATVRLADGSTAMLGPATSLTVTSDSHTVTGEAYFTITPRSRRPFVVRTESSLIHVLGTRFAVRQYPGETESRVVVEGGRVAVRGRLRAGWDAAVLSPRMSALVTDSSVTVSSGVDTQALTGWTTGDLVFDHVALGAVVAELERAYGTDIRIADSTLARREVLLDVSVTQESLKNVLGSLCLVTNAHVTRVGRVYLLSPGLNDTKASPMTPVRQSFPQLEQQYGR